jgi:hypothetical protein
MLLLSNKIMTISLSNAVDIEVLFSTNYVAKKTFTCVGEERLYFVFNKRKVYSLKIPYDITDKWTSFDNHFESKTDI